MTIKPCYFCKSKNVSLYNEDEHIHVTCWNCDACGPWAYEEEIAISKWNARSPQESGTDKGLIELDEINTLPYLIALVSGCIELVRMGQGKLVNVDPLIEQHNKLICSKFGTKQQKELEICDTTNTKILPKIVCKGCETYIDNLGPCKTFCEGYDGRCAYCDHNLKCHPIAWHLIENQGTSPARPTVSVEDIVEIMRENIDVESTFKITGYEKAGQAIHTKFFGDKQ